MPFRSNRRSFNPIASGRYSLKRLQARVCSAANILGVQYNSGRSADSWLGDTWAVKIRVRTATPQMVRLGTGRRRCARLRGLPHALITGQYTKKSPDQRGFLDGRIVLVVIDPCCPFPSFRHRNDNDPFARSTVEARSAHRAAQPGTRRSSKRADDGCHPTW